MTLTHSLFDAGAPAPCPARFNLAAHALWAGQPDDKVALVVAGERGDERLAYGDLREAVARTAGGLRAAGLAPGDRVMLRLGPGAAFPVAFLGAIAAGGVAVPVSTMLTAPEAGAIAADVGARFVVADAGVEAPAGAVPLAPAALARGPAAPVAATGADDPAFVVYTSGSSGRPKGVAHAHRAAWARRMIWRGWSGLGADDVVLHAGALNWTYTLGVGLLDPWGAGATAAVWAGPRDPAVWPHLAARVGATIFAAVPGVYRQLLKYGANIGAGFAGLRCALSAGEAMPAGVAAGWQAATGVPLYEALGMSEISTYVSASADSPPRPGFVGPPQPGRRVAVLVPGTDRPAPIGETGELAVSRRDPGLTLGYWNDPGATRAACRGEWFVTGDLATMAADGYVAWKGRADDQMNAGGYRVSPQEVEEALLAHPAVAEAAAVELPVAEGVSIVAAFVVAPGATAEALDAWCAGRLAAYKRPRRIEFRESLPRTATGKLLRRALVVAAAQRAATG